MVKPITKKDIDPLAEETTEDILSETPQTDEIFSHYVKQLLENKGVETDKLGLTAQAISKFIQDPNALVAAYGSQGAEPFGTVEGTLSNIGQFAKAFAEGRQKKQQGLDLDALQKLMDIRYKQAQTKKVSTPKPAKKDTNIYPKDTIVQNARGNFVFIPKGTSYQVADDLIKSEVSTFGTYDFDTKNDPINYLKLGSALYYKKDGDLPESYVKLLPQYGLTMEDLVDYIKTKNIKGK